MFVFFCFLQAFISKNVGGDSCEVFRLLEDDVESYNKTRISKKIDYQALRKGFMYEVRFVIGKIILETMKDGVDGESQDEVIDDDDMVEEDEMYNLVESEDHRVGDKEDDPDSPLSVLSANKSGKEQDHNNLEEDQEAIITKRRRVVEIPDCNEQVKNKYQEEFLPKNPNPSLQAKLQWEKKRKGAAPEANLKRTIHTKVVEAKEQSKPNFLTVKNKVPVLSRLFR